MSVSDIFIVFLLFWPLYARIAKTGHNLMSVIIFKFFNNKKREKQKKIITNENTIFEYFPLLLLNVVL